MRWPSPGGRRLTSTSARSTTLSNSAPASTWPSKPARRSPRRDPPAAPTRSVRWRTGAPSPPSSSSRVQRPDQFEGRLSVADGGGVALASADAECLFEIEDEDLAIADLAGA